jgi:hypothetical protein
LEAASSKRRVADARKFTAPDSRVSAPDASRSRTHNDTVKRKPNPPTPTTNSAIGAGIRDLLAAEFDDQPFGVVGEWAVPRHDPAQPAATPWRPPLPDWDEEREERERRERERVAVIDEEKR